MTLLFQIILAMVCFATLWYVIRKISKSQIQIKDSVFWVVLALSLLVCVIFPGLPALAANLLGMYSTTNFIFLLVIFVLIIKIFTMSLRSSQQDEKIKQLAQKIALMNKVV